jgi:hypothetical protein
VTRKVTHSLTSEEDVDYSLRVEELRTMTFGRLTGRDKPYRSEVSRIVWVRYLFGIHVLRQGARCPGVPPLPNGSKEAIK